MRTRARTAPSPLVRALRAALRTAADPAKAPAMQAYMKSEMAYLGVQTPQLRSICRDVFAAVPLPSYEAWRDTTLTLWREATHREERYGAIELSGCRVYRDFAELLEALPLYEEMIVTGAWWDYVDVVAAHRLGPLLRRHPAVVRRTMRAWAKSGELWKRRSAILCQLAFKRDTDLSLLYACIEPAMGESEFFLRKAIGWALREYAKTDGAEVLRYVREHRRRLSPLSKREALKGLLRVGVLKSVP